MKRRPLADDARHTDRAAMRLDCQPTEGQAQAGAILARVTRPVDAPEFLEDQRQMLIGYTWAGIFDLDLERCRRLAAALLGRLAERCPGAHDNTRARRSMFDRI